MVVALKHRIHERWEWARYKTG